MSCPVGQVAFAFDQTNPQATRWARQRAASLVTNVTAQARAAVRAVVVQAFADGIAPRDAAKMIRGLIGLTERDATAVATRQASLLRQGVSPSQAAAAARRYADKLHRARALTIARTETMAAANAGQQELWRQAIKAGAMSKNRMKVWITADPCVQCAPLEGETVPVMDDFSVGTNPPLHPRCRCTIGIVA